MESYKVKVLFTLLLATPLILLTPVVIPTQLVYAQEAGIRLLAQCDNGAYPQWLDEDGTPKDTVTYKIIVKAPSVRESQINAVREGIERWDGFVHNIEEVGADEDADIVVTLAIRPKLEAPVPGTTGGVGRLGFWVERGDLCAGTLGEVIIGMKSAQAARTDTTSLANLATHEFGHALNLDHSNYEQDIMYVRPQGATQPQWGERDYCPSNLDVEAITAQESPYFVEDWEELNC